MFRLLAKNTAVNALGLAIRIGASLAITSFLVGRLGNERYGLWTLALTFTLSGALSLFSLGFQGALVKYVAQYRAQELSRQLNEAISATLLVYSASAVIGCLAMLAISRRWLPAAFHIPAADQAAFRFVVGLFSLQLLVELPALAMEAVLEGLQRYDIRAGMDLLKTLLFAGAAVLAVRTGAPVISLAAAQVLTTLLSSALAVILVRRLLPEWRLIARPGRTVVREMFGFTNDLLVLRINGVIYNNMDKWIIGATLASSAVAEYDIANRIHGLAAIVMGLASSAVVPAASALEATEGAERLRSLMLRGTKYTLAITLPVVCAVAVLARPLITLWISPAHAPLAVYVQLFMLYVLFWAMTPVYWNMLVGVKETRPMLRIQAISVAVNLALTFLLVRRVGVAGAMLGTLAGNAVAFLPYTRLAMRRFGVTANELVRCAVLTTYPQAAFAGAVLFALARLRPPASLFEVALYGAACAAAFLLAFCLTGLDERERQAAGALLARRSQWKSILFAERAPTP